MAGRDEIDVMIEDLEKSLAKLRALDLAKVPYEFRQAIRGAMHLEEQILGYHVYCKKNPGLPYPGRI